MVLVSEIRLINLSTNKNHVSRCVKDKFTPPDYDQAMALISEMNSQDTDSSNEIENSNGQESSSSDPDQESSSEEDYNVGDEKNSNESDVGNNEDIYPELSGTHNDILNYSKRELS